MIENELRFGTLAHKFDDSGQRVMLAADIETQPGGSECFDAVNEPRAAAVFRIAFMFEMMPGAPHQRVLSQFRNVSQRLRAGIDGGLGDDPANTPVSCGELFHPD